MCLRPSHVLSLEDEEGTDLYCSQRAHSRLSGMLKEVPLRSINWLDSGDYHYLSRITTDRIGERFSLVLFDHHPDMQIPSFGRILSCGGWLRDSLEDNPFLSKVVVVGIAPSLVEETEGFPGKVSVVPETALPVAPETILELLPEDLPVYLSIDKDVLSDDYASTNWDQGSMTLANLLSCICGIGGRRRILGADICGELSVPKGARVSDFVLNSLCNQRLYDTLCPILRASTLD